MKSFIRIHLAVAGLASALPGVPAQAAHLPLSFHDFGHAVTNGAYERTVNITPDMRSVGIYRLEKIKFVDQKTGKDFVWDFSTFHQEDFPLSAIALPGVLAGQAVRAYVWSVPAPNID